MTSDTTYFGLLRHAETVWNRQNRIQGRLDSPLTETGIETHRRWGAFLASPVWSWDRIICSPSPRTQQSAHIINESLGVAIETVEGIREQHWGQWEGLTMEEILATYHDMLRLGEQNGWDFTPPAGESRSTVLERVSDALTSCAERHPGERILVISHQGVIKSLIYTIENRRFLPDEPKLIEKNRLHTITLRNGSFCADQYNIGLPEAG